MEDPKDLVCYLNTLVAVPSALVVSSPADLRDGEVLVDVISAYQHHRSPGAPPFVSLHSAVTWLSQLGQQRGPGEDEHAAAALRDAVAPLFPPGPTAAAVLAGDEAAALAIVSSLKCVLPETLEAVPPPIAARGPVAPPPVPAWGTASGYTPGYDATVPATPQPEQPPVPDGGYVRSYYLPRHSGAGAGASSAASHGPGLRHSDPLLQLQSPSDHRMGAEARATALVALQQPIPPADGHMHGLAIVPSLRASDAGLPPARPASKGVRFSEYDDVTTLSPMGPVEGEGDGEPGQRLSAWDSGDEADELMMRDAAVRAAASPDASRGPPSTAAAAVASALVEALPARTGPYTTASGETPSELAQRLLASGTYTTGAGAKRSRGGRFGVRGGGGRRRRRKPKPLPEWNSSTATLQPERPKSVVYARQQRGGSGGATRSGGRGSRTSPTRHRGGKAATKAKAKTKSPVRAELGGAKVRVDARGLRLTSMVDPTFTVDSMAALLRDAPAVPQATAGRRQSPRRHRDGAGVGGATGGVEGGVDEGTGLVVTHPQDKFAANHARALMEIDVANAMLPDDAPSPPKTEAVAAPRAVFRVGSTSAALTPDQTSVVEWVRDLGVSIIRHEAQGKAAGAGTTKRRRKHRITAKSLAKAAQDGVFLCEVVAAAESKAGSRIRVSVSSPDDHGRKRLTLPGVSSHPRTTAAITKNINLALSILRKNPVMPTRHLWSANLVRRGDVTAIWELMADIRKCYASKHRPRPRRRRVSTSTAASKASTAAAAAADETHAGGTGAGSASADVDMMRTPTRSRGVVRRRPDATPPRGSPAHESRPAASTTDMVRTAPAGRGQAAHEDDDSVDNQYQAAGARASSGALDIAMLPTPTRRATPTRSRAATAPSGVGYGEGLAGVDEAVTFDAVTDLQVQDVRAWLQMLGVGLTREEEDAYVLDNPLCNGVLLCEVAGIIRPPAPKRTRRPKSLRSARGNLEAALKRLRTATPTGPPVPSAYLWNTESILKGNMDAVWGLLHCLRLAFPAAQPTSYPSKRVGVAINTLAGSVGPRPGPSLPRLPYSTIDMWRLERSLLSWLYSLGILRQYSPAGVPRDLQQIDDVLRDGTFLCALAQTLGRRVVGVFRKPRTAACGLSNLRKAVEALSQLSGISQTFLRAVEPLAVGERHATLGVLEACHRWYDGVAARDIGPAALPYFGSHVPPDRPPVAAPEGKGVDGEGDYDMAADINLADVSGVGHLAAGYEDAYDGVGDLFPAPALAPLTAPMELQALAVEPRAVSATLHDTLRTDIADAVPVSDSTRLPEPTYVDGGYAVPSRTGGSRIPRYAGAGAASAASSRRGDGGARSSATAGASRGGYDEAGGSEADSRDGGGDQHLAERTSNVAVLVEWLATLNIALKEPWALTAEVAPEFGDGLLLARIVEAVSHMRGAIKGVDRNPRTAAARLQNIRRSLEILRKKKEMPMDLLWSDVAMRAGDTSVIVPLLMQVRKAYGHHLGRKRGLSATTRA